MPSGKDTRDDRRSKVKERDRSRDKDRERHQDKDSNRDRNPDQRDKSREYRKDRERKDHNLDHDKEGEHKKDRDKEREHRKDRKGEHQKDRAGEHRKDRDRHRDEDKGERRHRDHDGDDRSHRKRDEVKRDRPKRDREDGERRRERPRRDEDDDYYRRETRHYMDEADEGSRHQDRDERRSKRKDDDKHRDDKDERRRHRDQGEEKSRDREHRSSKHQDEEEAERKKRHEERKARKKREEQERLEREQQAKEKEEENGGYDYDDDFEDYDDDFENDDENDGLASQESSHHDSSHHANSDNEHANDSINELQEAMNHENERLLSESRRNRYKEEKKDSRSTSNTKRTLINFVSAKQRQINKNALGKVARRGYQLQEMIEFDVVEYDIFDMPPVTEYTMYMRSFGSSNTRQAYVQTNEDNIDRDLQTEEMEFSEKWTQHPPSEILASGDPSSRKSENELDLDRESRPVDLGRMAGFIERASQVMTILMEEDFLDTLEQKHSRSQQSSIIISDTFVELSLPTFLKDRPVISTHFSPVHSHMLLTLHDVPDQMSSDTLLRLGFVCVWNVNDPSQPQKVLVCESLPLCCCFSPTKTNLVFAGMLDGSVVCWDTKEASSMHRAHRQGDTGWLLRYPSYNTAGVLHYDNHQSPVISISTIVAAGESASASLSGLAQTESGDGSFQLVTLEESGTLLLWVVAELTHVNLAGSESDYGLAPGSKVKLVHSSTITLDNPLRDMRLRTTMKCVDLQLLPSNNSHYYVATNMGCVVHGVRYGGKAPPRAFRPIVDNLVQVTSLDFSPFSEPVFLAGCEDGSLRLYHADIELPIATWPASTEGCPIRKVLWCRSRPAVFFVLDVESRLHIWDLLMDDSSPLKQEVVSKHCVSSISLSNDHSSTGLGLPGRRPQMVVCLGNGACEIHTMSQQFSALMADELDQFSSYLQQIC